MPRGDGTGPGGAGPMTGRAAGFCAGFSVPGFANAAGGRGFFGRGRGFFGAGFGRGFGRGAGFGMSAYGAGVNSYAQGQGVAPVQTPKQELESLKGQAEYFSNALEDIKKRIEELGQRQ